MYENIMKNNNDSILDIILMNFRDFIEVDSL